MVHALIGTNNGLYELSGDRLTPLGLQQHRVSAVHATNGDPTSAILAGTYGDGLFRSEDHGASWRKIHNGLTASAFRTLTTSSFAPQAILAGTEPGRIFRSADLGSSWTELDGIPQLESAGEWYLPYSPRAGAVRNIYTPPKTDRLLASVEVGGLLSSDDRGETWSISPVAGDTDIHFVTGHPHQPDLVYAALGWASLKSVQRPSDAPPLGGVARSDDGGATWRKFHSDYTRAVLVPPAWPDLIVAGPAKKVGAQGRFEVSSDGGESWQSAMGNLDSPLPDMVEELLQPPDTSIWALMSGGSLLRAEPGEWAWEPVAPTHPDIGVQSVAFLRDQ